jgi:hypothetical protein
MNLLFVVVLAAFLSACTKTPPLKLNLSDPSNAAVRVKPVTYNAVGAGYESNRPVGPKDWMKINQLVAPGGK